MQDHKKAGSSAARHALVTVIAAYLGVWAARKGYDLPPDAAAEAAEKVVAIGLAAGSSFAAILGAAINYARQHWGSA